MSSDALPGETKHAGNHSLALGHWKDCPPTLLVYFFSELANPMLVKARQNDETRKKCGRQICRWNLAKQTDLPFARVKCGGF